MRFRSTSLVFIVSIAAAAGCKKEKGQVESTPVVAFPRADTSELWAMVPAKADFALVVAPGSALHVQAGVQRVMADMGKLPFGADALSKMRQEEPELARILAPKAEDEVGADLKKGAVIYWMNEELVAIIPIADPAKILALGKGEVKGDFHHYDGGEPVCTQKGAYYACGDNEQTLSTIGADGGMKSPPENMRGHLEVVVSKTFVAEAMKDEDLPFTMGAVRSQVTLEPGGFSTRAFVEAQVPEMFRTKGAPKLLEGLASKSPSGLMSIRLAPVWSTILANMPPRSKNEMTPFGFTTGDALAALSGDFAAYALPGPPGGRIRIGVKDRGPFEKLLPLCEQVPPMVGSGKRSGDKCTLELKPPNMGEFKVSIELTDNTLEIDLGNMGGDRPKTALREMGKEVLDGEYGVASWGYGSLLTEDIKLVKDIPEFTQALADHETQMGVWALLHLSEWGMAVGANDKGISYVANFRTTWSNPAEVVDGVEPIMRKVATGDFDAIDGVKGILKKHPKSPLAADLAGGAGGSAPAAVIGVLSAVAIPAFMKYIKKSKTTEARMFVKKMSDGARAFAMDAPQGAGFGAGAEAQGFPKVSTPLTPPAGSCCGGPEDKCMPDPKLWEHPTWVQLQFSIDDPHYYSYQYEAKPDGTYVARAIGDLDCDGVFSTFEMYGEIKDGVPDDTMGGSMYRENELE